MDKLGLSGVASGLHPVTVRRKITGRVQTVQFAPVPGHPPVTRLPHRPRRPVPSGTRAPRRSTRRGQAT